MKPATPVARRGDYIVRPVAHSVAVALIVAHHYARGAASTSVHAFGLFREGIAVGVGIWLPPTRICAETVNAAEWRRVLSLSRLAIVPGEPTNAASMFLGGMIRHIRAEGRWCSLVTFADESQGHTGTIYKATNWTYVGPTKPEPRWVAEDGRQVSRLSTKSRTAAQMRALGYRVSGSFPKRKYVMHLRAKSLPSRQGDLFATRAA